MTWKIEIIPNIINDIILLLWYHRSFRFIQNHMILYTISYAISYNMSLHIKLQYHIFRFTATKKISHDFKYVIRQWNHIWYHSLCVEYDIIHDYTWISYIMMISLDVCPFCATAAAGSPRPGLFAAPLPRLNCPNPTLAATLAPDSFSLCDVNHPEAAPAIAPRQMFTS